MLLPTNIATGRVTGQFLAGVVDGVDDDQDPDAVPAAGFVTFTASVPYLPDPTAAPNPATILTTSVVAVLDNEGYLCTPAQGTLEPSYRGVRLIATDDPDLSVEGWTWNATYSFSTVAGQKLAIPTHSFAVPSGGVVDLTTVVKVPSSAGIGTEQAEALAASAQAAAIQSAQDAATAVQAAVDAAAAAQVTDTGIAALVATPGSATALEVAGLVDESNAGKLGTDDAVSIYQSQAALDAAAAAKVNTAGTATNTAVKAIADASAGQKIPTSEKGAANGVATLDAGGKVPDSQLPETLAFIAPAPGGVDDTAALQAKIDAASASAFTKRVVGRTGVYVVTQVIVPANVTLANIAIKHKAASTLAAVRITGDGAAIERVEVDGNVANQTVDINGVEVAASRVTVTGCYVHDTKFKGIAITTAGTYAMVRGNSVVNSGASGIDVVGGSWSTVSGNTVNTTGAAGMGVSGGALGVAVTGNTIKYSTLDGVVAYESTLREMSIVGNTIESPGNHGVHVGGSGHVVANNTIKNVLVGSGVFVRNHDSTTATDIAFTGNTVRGAVMSGARVELATNATVTGNSFTDCNDGIFVDGCTNVTATGNAVKNARAVGARVNATSNVTFTGNILESSTLDATYFLSTIGVTYTGNIIAGTTTGRGFRMFQVERATISGNTFRNVSSDAIYGSDGATPAAPCRYVTVTGNTIHTAGAGIKSVDNSDYWTVGLNTFAGITGADLSLVGTNNKTYTPATTPANLQYAPAGALATTMDRRTVGGSSIAVVPSGTMRMTAIWLAKGTVVTSLTYLAGTVGVSVTNRWFALYDLSKNLLRTTADNAAAWAAGTTLTLPLSSAYTIPSDGLYYIGICEVATTTTALRGIVVSGNAVGISPPLNGDGSTGLTNAASTPTPGPAITVSGNLPYAYVS